MAEKLLPSGVVPEAVLPDSIETVLVPRARDLGGFEVLRALPAPQRQMVGPFIFFDQAGPAEFVSGKGIDVRPHPHIGIATVTYLFQGEFQHRDSLGSDQMIYPGDVNWMVAGGGITHSERTSAETRRQAHKLFGIQTWVALPEDAEDTTPEFSHTQKADLPLLAADGISARVILGNSFGATAPVKTFSEMFYVDAVLEAGRAMPLPDGHEDRGAFVLSGSVDVAGDTFGVGQMMVFRPGDAISMRAGDGGARVMLLGGETLNGPRHLWWNFVSSSKEILEQAKKDWAAGDWQSGRFRLPPGDEDEFIPLPG